MNLIRSRLMLVSVLLLAAPAAWAQQSLGTEADVAAIKQVFKDFYDGFSRHDPKGIAMTFTEDADFTNMGGVKNHGREDIEQKFITLFKGRNRAATRTDIVKNIRFYTPELATADADTTIIGSLASDGSIVPPRKGLMIATLVKRDGRWLMSEFHEAEFP
jgi:uncharacterized protein (TIGR02246 family)